jgi:MoxR-like ATPase
MPSDITGTDISRKTRDRLAALSFHARSHFANIVLADEINHPRTQAAFFQPSTSISVTAGSGPKSRPAILRTGHPNPIEQEARILSQRRSSSLYVSHGIDYRPLTSGHCAE